VAARSRAAANVDPGGSTNPGGGVDPTTNPGGGNPVKPGMPGMPPSDRCGGALPGAFISNCSACHTPAGAANMRYPDLFNFKGSLADFQKQVRGGSANMAAYSPDLISDGDLQAAYSFFTGMPRTGMDAVDLGGVQPLFVAADAKNPPIVVKRDDGALVTRGAGRVRGRHEKEGSYGLFLNHYFEDRTYGFMVEDWTPTGKQEIRVTYLPIAKPDHAGNRITNWRAWKVQGNKRHVRREQVHERRHRRADDADGEDGGLPAGR